MQRFSSLTWVSLIATVLGLGLVLDPAPSQSQPEDDLAAQVGYVDLSGVDSWFDAEPATEVDIRGPLVDLVAEAAKSSDPAFAGIMGNVTAIQVRGYPLPADRASNVRARTGQLASSLEESGWTRVIFVREQDEEVSIYLREADDRVAGLTLLSTKPGDKSVFVNIVGSLSPDQIAALGRGLNLSALEQVDVSRNTPE
ncbi:MAG: DUF4252 domain-containing protein [Bacteroidetes bacterium]|jgi:hypothetical protein|nr:DUF4252 domain-containing protein [Bacteroidota bacterium]